MIRGFTGFASLAMSEGKETINCCFKRKVIRDINQPSEQETNKDQSSNSGFLGFRTFGLTLTSPSPSKTTRSLPPTSVPIFDTCPSTISPGTTCNNPSEMDLAIVLGV